MLQPNLMLEMCEKILLGELCNGFLHKNQIYRRDVRKGILVKEVNQNKRLSWFLKKRRLTVNQYWRNIIFGDESQVVLSHQYRLYVWRFAYDAYRPECTFSECKPKVSVMNWGVLPVIDLVLCNRLTVL